MREFILLARKAFTTPFKLNDLPGAGRIDLVARCISTAIFISEALRKDVKFYAVLEGPTLPPKIVTFDTSNLKNVYPDERNIASHIKIALEKGINLKLGEEVESEPGIRISKKSFESLVKEKVKETQVIYLHPKGKKIEEFEFEKDVCFILGDHKGLPKKKEIFLENLGIEKLSLGKITYLASQVIAILHYELDKRNL